MGKYVIIKDGERVRSCDTPKEVERALRFIPGAIMHELCDVGRLPSASKGRVHAKAKRAYAYGNQ